MMDVSGVGHTRRRQNCVPCVDHVLVITTWFKSAISDVPGVPIHSATNIVEVKPPTVDACAEDTWAKLNDGQSDRRQPTMPSLCSVVIISERGARWAGVRTEGKKDGRTDRWYVDDTRRVCVCMVDPRWRVPVIIRCVWCPIAAVARHTTWTWVRSVDAIGRCVRNTRNEPPVVDLSVIYEETTNLKEFVRL